MKYATEIGIIALISFNVGIFSVILKLLMITFLLVHWLLAVTHKYVEIEQLAYRDAKGVVVT